MFDILPVWQIRKRMASLFVFLGIVTLSPAYVNVALNKSAYQQNAYQGGDDRFDASNAVAGRKSDLSWNGGQCVVSADFKHTAIWWVNLNSIHSIHHITIYYRTDNVQWQWSANEPSCSSTCKTETCRYCDNTTGNCTGCIPGFQGYQCQLECNDGMFGDLCQSQCGHCLDMSKCHHVNGTCLNGCKPGYTSTFCNQSCPDGTYGTDCSARCGKCRGVGQCNHIDGTCKNGCEIGYNGSKCTEDCDGHLFGENCSKQCGHCLDSVQCHHINGTCMNGCDSGYKVFFARKPVTVICMEKIVPCLVDTVWSRSHVITSMGHV